MEEYLDCSLDNIKDLYLSGSLKITQQLLEFSLIEKQYDTFKFLYENYKYSSTFITRHELWCLNTDIAKLIKRKYDFEYVLKYICDIIPDNFEELIRYYVIELNKKYFTYDIYKILYSRKSFDLIKELSLTFFQDLSYLDISLFDSRKEIKEYICKTNMSRRMINSLYSKFILDIDMVRTLIDNGKCYDSYIFEEEETFRKLISLNKDEIEEVLLLSDISTNISLICKILRTNSETILKFYKLIFRIPHAYLKIEVIETLIACEQTKIINIILNDETLNMKKELRMKINDCLITT